jgi:hypothetical protein
LSSIKFVNLALIFSLVYGCGLDIGNQDLINNIKINNANWNSANIVNYSFTYSRTPMDCPTIDVMPPVRITVENDSVVAVFNPSTGIVEQNISGWPTMDDIFSQMLEDASLTTRVFGRSYTNQDSPPAFDEELGFPSSYFFDVTEQDCDAVEVSVSNFEETP